MSDFRIIETNLEPMDNMEELNAWFERKNIQMKIFEHSVTGKIHLQAPKNRWALLKAIFRCILEEIKMPFIGVE